VNRPNVMFKVPATPEGFNAIEELTAAGININITLIFSLDQYLNTAEAYLNGILRRLKADEEVQHIRSVASVFVSRIDTLVDKKLEGLLTGTTVEQTRKQIEALKGKAAVANSRLIYKKYRDLFWSDNFRMLHQQGAQVQRLLWGSTSTKNPAYTDIKYITELIAKDTINTMPEATLISFLDHGAVKEAMTENIQDANTILEQLNSLGIDINPVCAQLLQDGAEAFVKSFVSLLSTIEQKAKSIRKK
jgi:transaldolase